MSHRSSARARRGALALLTTAALVAAGLTAGAPALAVPSGAEPAVPFEDGTYVVIFRDAPSATYTGGVPGLAATKVPRAEGFTHDRRQVRDYESYLVEQQREALAAVGAEPVSSFTTAVNASAVLLTGEQAAELAQRKDVLAVTPDELRTLDTVSSPAFLGLDGPQGGVWQQVGGPEEAGAGTVVGIVDSGYWPESASFAGERLRTARTVTPAAPGPVFARGPAVDGTRRTLFLKGDGRVFTGACVAGERFRARLSNDKVISARYFDAGFSAAVERGEWAATEFRSARDGDGHGSHTASTAAGNHGVPMSVEGRAFGTGSGMAPGARLAVYKVCWEAGDPDSTGCYTTDSVAAINQAVQDGVDVLNFSISGSETSVIDAVEYAFYGAANAGVFVAVSAGNSGPTASTVAHNSPWLTTVAASTHVAYEGTVRLGADGPVVKGASISDTGVPTQTRTVLAGAARLPAATVEDARLCAPGSLDPAVVTGAIVVCDRGVVDRVVKSQTVAAAGGVGVILANTTPGSLDADFHVVPTVHVDEVAGDAIKAHVAAGGTTALLPGNLTGVATPTPQIAGFSSRGPARASDSSLLKPDISAPGVSVLAAVAPPSGLDRDFDFKSGTSMASPHVAGLAALYLGEHPTWSPAAVKSAMMTTAYDLVDPTGQRVADPFAQGAGHVDPTRFLEPGLVLESGLADWARFLTTQGRDVTGGFGIDPSDLNYPSIAVGQLAGARTIERTFTAVTPGTYTVAASVPGFDVQAEPSVLELGAVGSRATVAFTFTRTTAEPAEWASGSVTITGPETVRMPVALRPVSVEAPAEVAAPVEAGAVAVEVRAGFTGDLEVEHAGLAEGTARTGSLAPGQAAQHRVTVPAGTSIARFDLDAGNDAADLDLFVLRLNAEGTAAVAVAGQSSTSAADERVDLWNPVPGQYLVQVQGFANAPGESAAAFTHTDYVVTPDAGVGGLAVRPNPVPVTQGELSTFGVTWSGLVAGRSYLGWVGYEGALEPTLVSVG